MHVPKAAALRVLLRTRTGWSDVFMLGAKNAIFAPFIYKTIISPRPAQDKHRENSKKSGCVLCSGGGGRAWDGVLWCLGEWREASVVTAKHRCGAKRRVSIDYFIRRVMVPSLSWQSISSTLCKPPLKSQCRHRGDFLQGTFAIVGWIKPHRCFSQEWSSTRRWRMISERKSTPDYQTGTEVYSSSTTANNSTTIYLTWYNIVLVQKVLRGAAWLRSYRGVLSIEMASRV